MESLITLLKIILFIYLGIFTYLTYQIIFFFQKRFVIIKTFSYFIFLAVFIIEISNKYSVDFFIGYIFFYCLGIYISRAVLKAKILKNAKVVKYFVIKPASSILMNFIKKIIFFDQLLKLKKTIKLYRYYKKYPYKKPKTVYELF